MPLEITIAGCSAVGLYRTLKRAILGAALTLSASTALAQEVKVVARLRLRRGALPLPSCSSLRRSSGCVRDRPLLYRRADRNRPYRRAGISLRAQRQDNGA